ncbi:MAG: hypothetical protein QOE93_1370 [Actinomycetota bacterium]|nr:hypothetical protein [Actinomycetota bacterium]
MTTDHDPVDPLGLFAAMNQVDPAVLTPTDRHRPAQDLLFRLLSGDEPPVAIPRPRLRRALAITVAVVAGAGLGSAWIVSRPATNPLDVACYGQPGFEGEVAGVAPSGTGADPIAVCSEVWRTGALAGRGPVPDLVGCVTTKGTAAVFPAESPDLCDTLGLERLGVSPATDDAVVTLRDELTATFLASGCLAPDDAVARARAPLEQRGLGEWRIDNPGPYPPERPCASFSFDAAGRAVALVPFPDRSPSTTTTGGTTP